MARLSIVGSELLVSLSRLERIGALHGNLRVPLASVAEVAATDKPRRLLRGIRARGTGVPGVIALGTWRYRGGRDFAALYRRLPAVVVTIAGGPFTRLLIASRDAEAIATRLRAAMAAGRA